jgi:hypothetical protein
VIPRLAFCLLLAGASTFAAVDGPKRAVSSSKQFTIYSDDATTRSLASVAAEDNKREFLELLREKDAWKHPIIINFTSPPNTKRPPRSQIGIFEGEHGNSKIQIDIFDAKLVKEPDFHIQVLTALVLEYMHRGKPVKAGRSFQSPPAWFVEGLFERTRTLDGNLPASLYSGLLSGSETPKLPNFLGTEPARLDATSQAIYRAQAVALLEAVLALPDSQAGLRAYLSSPRRSPATVEEIVAVFPSLLGSREALGRKWVLAMARASAANRTNLMTVRETSRQLDEILAVKPLPDPRRPEVAAMSGPYALPTIARSQNGRFILAQLENSLLRLSLRAHPLYKSLVDQYLLIIRNLAKKPKRREDKRIAAAEEIRASLNRETGDVRDYIDWVEATKVKTRSPELEHAIEDVDELEAPPTRSDAISRYLDAAAERGY